MKRNMELIRDILIAVENDEDSSDLDGYTIDEIKFHQALAIEAGFIDGEACPDYTIETIIPTAVIINKLTWVGYEFLDNIRQEDVWSTIKNEFKDASFSTVFNVGKQLAEGYAKQKVERLLNL